MIKKETKSRFFILVETFDDFVLLSPSFEFFGKTHQNVNCFRLSELCESKIKTTLNKEDFTSDRKWFTGGKNTRNSMQLEKSRHVDHNWKSKNKIPTGHKFHISLTPVYAKQTARQ